MSLQVSREDRSSLEEKYKELYERYAEIKREISTTRKVDKTELEEKLERKDVLIKKSIRKEKVLNRALEDQRKVNNVLFLSLTKVIFIGTTLGNYQLDNCVEV